MTSHSRYQLAARSCLALAASALVLVQSVTPALAQARAARRGASVKTEEGGAAAGRRGAAVKTDEGAAAVTRHGAAVKTEEGVQTVSRHGGAAVSEEAAVARGPRGAVVVSEEGAAAVGATAIAGARWSTKTTTRGRSQPAWPLAPPPLSPSAR